MRILFVKLSSIGDIVHTLPSLAAVKHALPKAEISWVVEKGSAEILRNNLLLSKLIEIDAKALRQRTGLRNKLLTACQYLRESRSTEFDLSIDFQGLLKSAIIAKFSKVKRRFGFSKQHLREPLSRFFQTDEIDVKAKIHIISKNLSLTEESLKRFLSDEDFRLPKVPLEFPIITDKKHKKEAKEIIEKAGENFIILNPAGGWKTKLWDAKKYGQLADKVWSDFGLRSVVSTDLSETNLAERVLAGSQSGKMILAQPSLKGFFELAKEAKMYIGGDTAPTHLAVAAKCPVIGIFGPTEWWRNGSLNETDICVSRKDISCRVDCHRRTCDNWICMDISVDTVLDAMGKRL